MTQCGEFMETFIFYINVAKKMRNCWPVLNLKWFFYLYRFKLLLFNTEDHVSVREAVFHEMSKMTGHAEVDGAANDASAGNPPQYSGRKGSLLTTLSDIVHEKLKNSGGHAEQQPALPGHLGVLSKCQEISAYLSEPILPVRSPDGKANIEELRRYWYRHKDEWPALTRLALSYLSCPPSSVTSERVFSLAGNIVTKKRCALLPGNISKLAFIKFNYKKF